MEFSESKEQEVVKVEEVYDEFQIGGNNDFKVGQKYPTPAPANGDRVFYESLLIQMPKSEMAQEWCVAYGVLDNNKAREIDKIISARKGIKPSQSPKKGSSSSSSTTIAASVTVKKKAPKKGSYADDDNIVDTGMGDSSMWEGQGSSGY